MRRSALCVVSLVLAAAFPAAARADHTCVEVSGDVVTTVPTLGSCAYSTTPGHLCQMVRVNGNFLRVVVCVDYPVANTAR